MNPRAQSANRTAPTPSSRRKSRSADAVPLALRVRARQQTEHRQRMRTIAKATVWIFLALSLCLLAYLGGQSIVHRFFFENSDYNLSRITIQPEGYLTVEDFQKITTISLGTNLFLLDLEKAETELRKISELKNVRISKQYPDSLLVELEIRKPVAWVSEKGWEETTSELTLLVEADGSLFQSQHPPADYYGLPVICSVNVDQLQHGDLLAKKDLEEALNLIATRNFSPWSTFDLLAVDIRRSYALEVIGKEGLRVLFRPENYIEQLSRLQRLLDYSNESGRKMEFVNLFPTKNTAVHFLMASLPPQSVNEFSPSPQTALAPTKTSSTKGKPNPKRATAE